jgi:hypothetical protein
MKMGIYDASRLLSWIEAEPKIAWAAARAEVRSLAHADGVQGQEIIDQTANRPFIQRGIFRAMPMLARSRMSAWPVRS